MNRDILNVYNENRESIKSIFFAIEEDSILSSKAKNLISLKLLNNLLDVDILEQFDYNKQKRVRFKISDNNLYFLFPILKESLELYINKDSLKKRLISIINLAIKFDFKNNLELLNFLQNCIFKLINIYFKDKNISEVINILVKYIDVFDEKDKKIINLCLIPLLYSYHNFKSFSGRIKEINVSYIRNLNYSDLFFDDEFQELIDLIFKYHSYKEALNCLTRLNIKDNNANLMTINKSFLDLLNQVLKFATQTELSDIGVIIKYFDCLTFKSPQDFFNDFNKNLSSLLCIPFPTIYANLFKMINDELYYRLIFAYDEYNYGNSLPKLIHLIYEGKYMDAKAELIKLSSNQPFSIEVFEKLNNLMAKLPSFNCIINGYSEQSNKITISSLVGSVFSSINDSKENLLSNLRIFLSYVNKEKYQRLLILFYDLGLKTNDYGQFLNLVYQLSNENFNIAYLNFAEFLNKFQNLLNNPSENLEIYYNIVSELFKMGLLNDELSKKYLELDAAYNNSMVNQETEIDDNIKNYIMTFIINNIPNIQKGIPITVPKTMYGYISYIEEKLSEVLKEDKCEKNISFKTFKKIDAHIKKIIIIPLFQTNQDMCNWGENRAEFNKTLGSEFVPLNDKINLCKYLINGNVIDYNTCEILRKYYLENDNFDLAINYLMLAINDLPDKEKNMYLSSMPKELLEYFIKNNDHDFCLSDAKEYFYNNVRNKSIESLLDELNLGQDEKGTILYSIAIDYYLKNELDIYAQYIELSKIYALPGSFTYLLLATSAEIWNNEFIKKLNLI